MGPGEKLVAIAARRPLAFFTTFALLAVLAGIAESGFARLRSQSAEPGLGARWIWAQNVVRAGEPLTFYAARDFDLADDVQKVWLSLAASESYVLWVNGQAVGSGIWRDGATAADLYELSDWLESGRNRLVVELRSTSGAGGLLATLRFGDPGKAAILTDASWRIFRTAEPGLLRGLARIEELAGEEPQLWQWPPTGRWRLDRLEARPDLRSADPLYRRALCPTRLRFPSPSAPWTDLARSPGCTVPKLSDQSLWDFGSEVEGILEMGLVPKGDPQPTLIYFLDQEPKSELALRRPDAIVQAAPGAWLWRAAAVRRFRYVAIVGMSPHSFLRLQKISPEQSAAYQPPPPPQGVFGLEAPVGPTPLEESVWQRYMTD